MAVFVPIIANTATFGAFVRFFICFDLKTTKLVSERQRSIPSDRVVQDTHLGGHAEVTNFVYTHTDKNVLRFDVKMNNAPGMKMMQSQVDVSQHFQHLSFWKDVTFSFSDLIVKRPRNVCNIIINRVTEDAGTHENQTRRFKRTFHTTRVECRLRHPQPKTESTEQHARRSPMQQAQRSLCSWHVQGASS